MVALIAILCESALRWRRTLGGGDGRARAGRDRRARTWLPPQQVASGGWNYVVSAPGGDIVDVAGVRPPVQGWHRRSLDGGRTWLPVNVVPGWVNYALATSPSAGTIALTFNRPAPAQG